jgi:RNA polymerase sigma-70 factor (ECF subfamily)
MMVETKTDAEIVRRCLGGENDAFAGIVELYQDRIYSFALRLLKDAPAAEDAAQETFVKAFRALSSYNQSLPFSSWLFRIAHNACMDALRLRGRTVSMDVEDFPDLPDLGPGVADGVAAAIDSERIEALLASLPPLYSEALLLQYREDMGPAEIARVVGAPEGTIKARLFRAREMLKAKLADATVQGAAAYYQRGTI